MKRKNVIQILVIAVVVTFIFTKNSAVTYGQSRAGTSSTSLGTEDQTNDLVGAWEAVNVPAENDCVTGQPLPGTGTPGLEVGMGHGEPP